MVTDADLIDWLVDIAAAGPGSPTSPAEMARWLAAAVPRHHWTVLGHVWCSIQGLDGTRAEVIRVAGPMTPAEARRVLWAVRRRAWGALLDERAAESTHHRHEIPAGDFRGGAVA